MLKKTAVLLSTLLLSNSLSAHTLWLLPSHYVLSKQDSWISVDASAANMTFVPDKGISLASLTLHLPDGKVQQVTSVHQGKRKSMADIQLAGDGTYKLEMANPLRFFTSYELNGERKRLMANKQERAAQLPAGASKVETTQMRSRNFAYITVNSPTNTLVKLQGEGLEISSKVHPADVVAEEPLHLVFNLDGKPQAGVKGVLSYEGELYRNDAGRIEFETGADGAFSFTPATAGRYLIEASYSADSDSALADKVRESVTYTFEVALP
ncbi:MAG: DUF4198 domain-containing protein [Gammaproteobacteria bacterium]|nr:DUF4198 domain-containing protein [Gammaproteobacteria bacterium]MBU1554143.1 DUF4198 domain-containing protein [Gammaproteobacteria bacterium]MBU2072337.1 DUF4198 domain-containing protein [Gammaproteobacteria bacterium]MBU2183855.1 DUF4198 domain-containing protein [Gammaproteobacteria bacterium]MBU2203933.1 DUF4198 domain-containing protein [Gammaproteobacteria bacterium]